MAQAQEGVCHVCRAFTLCRFCCKCGHWLCENCKYSLKRVVAVLLYDGKPACCGPIPRLPPPNIQQSP